MTERKKANASKSKGDKRTLVTARHAVTQVMHRRGECRASEVAADLGLKETTVSSVMYALYIRGHAERVDRGVYQLVSLPENFKHLTERDEVKFVIAGREDYDFARRTVAEHTLIRRCEVIFSPAGGRLNPAVLAKWILADGLDVRLGLQLHKIIWPDKDRGT